MSVAAAAAIYTKQMALKMSSTNKTILMASPLMQKKSRKKAEKESEAAQDFIDKLYETVLPDTESSTIMDDDSNPGENEIQ